MTTTHTTSPPDPRSVFLKTQGVFDRYDWKKSSGYVRLKAPGFPRSLPGGVYRLDTLIAWEDQLLARPDTTDPEASPNNDTTTKTPPLPPKRTGGRKTKKEEN